MRARFHAQGLPRLRMFLLAAVTAMSAGSPAAWAEASAEFVSRLIQQLDPSSGIKVRLQAAMLLGQSGSPRALQPLAQALSDPDFAVRGTAAMGLGALQDPAAVKALFPALADPHTFVRDAAQRSLARLSEAPAAVPAILDAAKSPDEKQRQAAMTLLGGIKGREALRTLIRALGDEDAKVAAAAASAILNRGPQQARVILHVSMRDDDPQVVTRAIKTLMIPQLLSSESIDPLTEKLEAGVPPEVQAEARKALTVLRDQISTGRLLTDLQAAQPEPIRRRAVQILAIKGDEAALTALLGLLMDPAVELRAEAARALGQFHDPRAVKALRTAARAPNNAAIRNLINEALSQRRP